MRKGCVAETGVDEKYIDQSKNGNLPDVPELRCYILCLMEHSGVIDEASTIDFTKIFHLFTPSTKTSFQDASSDCGTIRNYIEIIYSYSLEYKNVNKKKKYFFQVVKPDVIQHGKQLNASSQSIQRFE